MVGTKCFKLRNTVFHRMKQSVSAIKTPQNTLNMMFNNITSYNVIICKSLIISKIIKI